jgi:TolA-binding protein
MKKLILGSAVALALAAGIAAPSVANAQTARSNWREARQEQRIRIANMRGQLTRFEYRQLQAGQNRIDRMQRVAERDGRVTPWEERRIERAQQIENARIQRFTHNGMNARGGGRRF